MWSIIKTCPINPEYNNSWYFYEDTNTLTEKEIPFPLAYENGGCSQAKVHPEQTPPPTIEELNQNEEPEFAHRYNTMKHHVEQAYILTLGLKNFNWEPFGSIGWESIDKHGTKTITVMSEVLPSPEAVVPLLTQCDKCNALAMKGWLRIPDKDQQSFAQGTATLTTAEWRALCRQLESELGEASYQIQKFQSETSKLFAKAEYSISISNPAVSETYIDKFQGRHAQYTILLHEAKDTLKQAKRLTSELRYWEFRSPAAVESNLHLQSQERQSPPASDQDRR